MTIVAVELWHDHITTRKCREATFDFDYLFANALTLGRELEFFDHNSSSSFVISYEAVGSIEVYATLGLEVRNEDNVFPRLGDGCWSWDFQWLLDVSWLNKSSALPVFVRHESGRCLYAKFFRFVLICSYG